MVAIPAATIKRLAQRACWLACETCSTDEIDECVKFLLETNTEGETETKELVLQGETKIAYEIFNYGFGQREIRIVIRKIVSG